jgi:hypothetical protein
MGKIKISLEFRNYAGFYIAMNLCVSIEILDSKTLKKVLHTLRDSDILIIESETNSILGCSFGNYYTS